jgi:hypothetical protein
MNEMHTLANSLRKVAHSSAENNGLSRTGIEKLATIALIHEQISKTAGLRSQAAGLIVPGVLSGAYGYSAGKKRGRKGGRREMYRAAAPHVKSERQRARASEAMARLASKYYAKKLREKNAGIKEKLLYGGAALAIPAVTYAGGKGYGKGEGRKAGRKEVARSAMADIKGSRSRSRRAGHYIRTLKHRYRQLQQAKKGGDS